MKEFKFQARFVSFEKNEEDEYFSVGFSEDEFNFENYMFFCRSYSEEEPEYTEINDQAYGGYNICKKAVLFDDKFLVNLTINDENWEINIDLKGVKLEKIVIEYLKFILEDKLK